MPSLPFTSNAHSLFRASAGTLVAVVSLVFCTQALAEGSSCHDAAAEKKLAGAAKTSFLKKCEKDAAASCDTQAAERKLAGAAKTSFTKKCVKDAVGG